MKICRFECENCTEEHPGSYGSGRFCSSKCARGFSTKANRDEINVKRSNALKGKATGRFLTDHQKQLMNAGRRAPGSNIEDAKIALNSLVVLRTNHPRLDAYSSLTPIKRVILEEQNFKCMRCNNDEWMGQPLVLELEHKDGDRTNNLRTNLECLCPNCHSLTSTWRGRNKTKKVSDEEMLAVLQETKSMHQSLIRLGLAPKGGNYKRIKRMAEQHNVEIIRFKK